MKIKNLFLVLLTILTLTFATNKSFAQTDPDLNLSIDELKKKYPIDWLEEKYGKVTSEDCDIGDDEPYLAEVISWPCGAICAKYPQVTNCPKQCINYDFGKKFPKNLVCSFFKYVYLPNSSGPPPLMPVAKFNDFSYSEIKSAFVNTNVFSEPKKCSMFEGNCHRINQIMSITFVYFTNKPENLLTKKEKLLKNFIFSKKISPFNKTSIFMDNCKNFAKIYLESSIPYDQDFCANFSNN